MQNWNDNVIFDDEVQVNQPNKNIYYFRSYSKNLNWRGGDENENTPLPPPPSSNRVRTGIFRQILIFNTSEGHSYYLY